MVTNMYTQCRVKYDDGTTDTAWIPDVFAKVGNMIDVDEFPELHGRVLEVYARTDKDMAKLRMRWKMHRKHSDV